MNNAAIAPPLLKAYQKAKTAGGKKTTAMKGEKKEGTKRPLHLRPVERRCRNSKIRSREDGGNSLTRT